MKLLNLNVIIIAIMLSACSTVNRGASDHFRIDTVPQGATVTTSVIDMSKKKRRKNQYGRYQDKNVVTAYHGCAPTPCAIKLPRRSEFVVSIEHPAYETTELFIRSSSLKGGTTTSAATNLASASASGLAVGGMLVAPMTSLGNLFMLTSPSVNTSGIATSGAAAGLGVGVGMIAVDMATGANLNLFPNPVIVELAPKGSIVRTDPLVGLHKTMVQAKSFSDTICAKRKKDRIAGEPSCKETRATYQEEKAAYQTLKRQQLDDFKAAIKMAKAKEKTTVTP